jgi:oxygen-dependent protoporphyrinogen oxidase
VDSAPLDDLATQAHETHVVVVGGGIGGLVAAYACAKIGIRVTLLEASERLGGALHTEDLGGLPVDLGAEGYATRDGAVRALVDELGLAGAVTPTAPRAEGIGGLPGGPVPLPEENVRGIPENPWDERVRRLIGWRGAWRAYLDRLRPPLTIGQERSLGRLVRTRMGELVLDRVVAPLSLGAFAIHPDDVDVEEVAPGLSAALTRTGSLAGAVSQLRAARRDAPRSGGDGLEGLDGGMRLLVGALSERLHALGVDISVGAPVSALAPSPGGRWSAVVDGQEVDAADHVVVATGAVDAHRLLSPLVPGLEPVPVTALDVVTLVVSDAALADAPPRTAVYAVPGRAAAASVTDSMARWPWLRDAASPDAASPDAHSPTAGGTDAVRSRVLKVTFGAPGEAPATAARDDAAAAELAVAEASALLGVSLEPADVRAAHRGRWLQPPPVSAIGRRAAAEAVRTAVHSVPGLAVAGAWVAGTGIAQVVPDALEEAERVRRIALWGSADPRP